MKNERSRVPRSSNRSKRSRDAERKVEEVLNWPAPRNVKEVQKFLGLAKRVQKGIAHWDKQNHTVPAPNCVLKVQEEIIKDEGL